MTSSQSPLDAKWVRRLIKFLIFISLRHSCSFMSVGEQVGQLRSFPDLLDKRPVISKRRSGEREESGTYPCNSRIVCAGSTQKAEPAVTPTPYPTLIPFQETCCSAKIIIDKQQGAYIVFDLYLRNTWVAREGMKGKVQLFYLSLFFLSVYINYFKHP